MLSGGRLDAGLGPGSSAADYPLAGIPFDERWARFDEAVGVMRALWNADAPPVRRALLRHVRRRSAAAATGSAEGPPIWIGSWGSTAGLRRVARLGDGWLASGYNTTPESFASRLADAQRHAGGAGPRSADLPVHDGHDLALRYGRRRGGARRQRSLSQMLRRPIEELTGRLPIGSPATCLELLGRYRACRPAAHPGLADARTRSSSLTNPEGPVAARDRSPPLTGRTHRHRMTRPVPRACQTAGHVRHRHQALRRRRGTRHVRRRSLDLVTASSLALGREVLDPGWRWSTHVKPNVGTDERRLFQVRGS